MRKCAQAISKIIYVEKLVLDHSNDERICDLAQFPNFPLPLNF